MSYNYLNDYELLEKRGIPDIHATEMYFRHKKTGARVLFLQNDDKNKSFYIAFRTLANNNKGIPHILEHTILSGSKKYPGVNTFSELSKHSLCNYVNGITFSDKTVYAFSNSNASEYDKTIDIFMDAVFHANILDTDKMFLQEGWHYELDSYEGELKRTGVVYNEMKGNYSSFNRIIKNGVFESLYPDTNYSNDAGGNPDEIINASYEEVKAYYKTFYHPSNAYIYLYGNLDVSKYLKYFNENYFQYYSFQQVPKVLFQKKFSETNVIKRKYSVLEKKNEDRVTIAYNYSIDTSLNKELYQAFDIIDYILVKSANAPIKKILLEAKICSDVISFFEVGILQPIYSIVIRDVLETSVTFVLNVIEKTLKSLLKSGLNKMALLAALQKMEFNFREAGFTFIPRGLYYGLTCLDSWIYSDMQPLLHVECLNTFSYLRKSIAQGYFEKLIETYLIENSHKSVLILEPTYNLSVEKEKENIAALQKIKSNLTKSELDKIINYSNKSSKNADIKLFEPIIKTNDLSKEFERVTCDVFKRRSVDYIHHNIETNGIIYATFVFDVTSICSKEFLPLLRLHADLFGSVDTAFHKSDTLYNEINISSGGLISAVRLYPDFHNPECVSVKYEIETKVLLKNFEKMLHLIWEGILHTTYENKAQLAELLNRLKVQNDFKLCREAKLTTLKRSMANVSKYGLLQELMDGKSYNSWLSKIVAEHTHQSDLLVEQLKNLSSIIFNSERLSVSLACNKQLCYAAQNIVEKYIQDLNVHSDFEVEMEKLSFHSKEAFKYDNPNCNIALSGNYKRKNNYVGSLCILKTILNYDFLFNNIRRKIGAYGALCSFSKFGESYFLSYQNPKIDDTLNLINEIPKYVETIKVDSSRLEKYKIGTIKKLNVPQTSYELGRMSLSNFLQNVSYEDLVKEREEILLANRNDIRRLSCILDDIVLHSNICISGNEQLIQASKEKYKIYKLV